MARIAGGAAMALWLGTTAMGFQEPPGLLDRFLTQIGAELARQTDYACSQQIERFGRSSAEEPWKKHDSLLFAVALAGGKEYYSRPGDRRFQDKPLAELVGYGIISTGQFAALANHVFASKVARITYRGESERAGRRAQEYEYDVPVEKSSYRLRMGSEEAVVGFQGSFHVDGETLDLLEFDVQAYDIPERLGLTSAETRLSYGRVMVGDETILLPTAATLLMGVAKGPENLNRARLSECRRFQADSAVRFEGETAANQPAAAAPPARKPSPLPPGALLELALESALDPAALKVGDLVRARLLRAPGTDNFALLPQGAAVIGSIVRVRKETVPFPIYEIGLEFGTLETGGVNLAVSASMVDVERAPGILSQARRLDPKFNPRSKPRMDVLVREFQQGQGILLWDARRGSIPRGLRMKWRVHQDGSATEQAASQLPGRR